MSVDRAPRSQMTDQLLSQRSPRLVICNGSAQHSPRNPIPRRSGYGREIKLQIAIATVCDSPLRPARPGRSAHAELCVSVREKRCRLELICRALRNL